MAAGADADRERPCAQIKPPRALDLLQQHFVYRGRCDPVHRGIVVHLLQVRLIADRHVLGKPRRRRRAYRRCPGAVRPDTMTVLPSLGVPFPMQCGLAWPCRPSRQFGDPSVVVGAGRLGMQEDADHRLLDLARDQRRMSGPGPPARSRVRLAGLPSSPGLLPPTWSTLATSSEIAQRFENLTCRASPTGSTPRRPVRCPRFRHHAGPWRKCAARLGSAGTAAARWSIWNRTHPSGKGRTGSLRGSASPVIPQGWRLCEFRIECRQRSHHRHDIGAERLRVRDCFRSQATDHAASRPRPPSQRAGTIRPPCVPARRTCPQEARGRLFVPLRVGCQQRHEQRRECSPWPRLGERLQEVDELGAERPSPLGLFPHVHQHFVEQNQRAQAFLGRGLSTDSSGASRGGVSRSASAPSGCSARRPSAPASWKAMTLQGCLSIRVDPSGAMARMPTLQIQLVEANGRDTRFRRLATHRALEFVYRRHVGQRVRIAEHVRQGDERVRSSHRHRSSSSGGSPCRSCHAAARRFRRRCRADRWGKGEREEPRGLFVIGRLPVRLTTSNRSAANSCNDSSPVRTSSRNRTSLFHGFRVVPGHIRPLLR